MGIVPRRTFAARLARLDGGELAALVADLRAARGWETTVEGTLVIAEREGRRRRIRVVPAGALLGRVVPRAPDLDDSDVVVDAGGTDRVAAAAREAGAAYVGPADLRAQLLYAVPRETGRTLGRRHLDWTLVPDSPSAGRAAGLRGPAVAALLLVLVAALAAGLPGPTTGPAAGSSPTPTAVGSLETADVTVTTPEGRAETPTEAPYPPGVAPDGIDDAAALADAHVGRTRSNRYAVTVRFYGPGEAGSFGNWTVVEWTLRVESRTNFRVDATYQRTEPNASDRADLGVYADGTTLYRRLERNGETRYVSTSVRTRRSRAYLAFTSSMIRRYLDTSESSVHAFDGDERVRVVATGTPARIDAPVTDYRAEATVTPGGRVTDLDVRYDLLVDGTGRRVRVGFDYDEFGTAAVDPPRWLEAARNATDG